MEPEDDFGPAPPRRGLRTGFTTGACAAAATRGACLALGGDVRQRVEIPLPAGFSASFELLGVRSSPPLAWACVIKDAGDDPDVTHGAQICAEVALGEEVSARSGREWTVSGRGAVAGRLAPGSTLELRSGSGVGVVTRPGLGLPVGGPAINPVPRRMIARSVREALDPGPRLVTVTVSVRDGEALARRTLNARLGIEGGLSILGTTGVVRPYSTAAWRASVLQAVDVAAATGCAEIVASTGGRSEAYARRLFPQLAATAFVEMGEFTGHLIKRARERGLSAVHLSGMIGKFSKLACGHFMTHVAGNQVDTAYLAQVVERVGGSADLAGAVRLANTARHAQELVQAAGQSGFFDQICADVVLACAQLAGAELRIEALLFNFEGGLLGRAAS
ncbi:MAG TPA: cobalt-precorrin-5B (C(1))-methyltransferase CbiD [Candidatus Nitrosotalea sp.]|nr:cobalt-precorrin-5B (C(1))-methyltransferase CbiD [Candidatus Nitrosotalea sp.]